MRARMVFELWRSGEARGDPLGLSEAESEVGADCTCTAVGRRRIAESAVRHARRNDAHAGTAQGAGAAIAVRSAANLARSEANLARRERVAMSQVRRYRCGIDADRMCIGRISRRDVTDRDLVRGLRRRCIRSRNDKGECEDGGASLEHWISGSHGRNSFFADRAIGDRPDLPRGRSTRRSWKAIGVRPDRRRARARPPAADARRPCSGHRILRLERGNAPVHRSAAASRRRRTRSRWRGRRRAAAPGSWRGGTRGRSPERASW